MEQPYRYWIVAVEIIQSVITLLANMHRMHVIIYERRKILLRQ